MTGGSGVIGRAICYRLAAEGALVYVCGTNHERVSSVVNEINEAGFQARPLVSNILEEDSVGSAFCQVMNLSSKIDLLVCCAGGGAREKSCGFIEQDMDVIDSVLNLNLRGGILCTKEACKYMVSRERGKIIIISSTVGLQGMPAYSEYAAAKAGLMAFVKSIAMELAPTLPVWGLKSCTRCALHSRWQLCCLTDVAYPLRVIRCGVHGFAMNPCESRPDSNRALLS